MKHMYGSSNFNQQKIFVCAKIQALNFGIHEHGFICLINR
jgi:hypothetical protein